MTTTEQRLTPPDVLDAVGRLAPTVAARATEVEAGRRVPRDLLDQLVDAGCFRLTMPASHGGLGAEPAAAMRVFERLAVADASVAWTVMIGGGAWCDLAGLPRAVFDQVFSRPDVIVAGVFAPAGTITAVDGGYRVSGRWSFASGCEHADVLYGNCLQGTVDGVPQLRMALFAPEQLEIEDTWTAAGLRGTGSHHFRVTDLFVPADHTFDPMAELACLDEPITRVPPPALFSPQIAAVALGIARGALDDLLGIATAKTPLLAGQPLAANPLFQFDLATADAELRAARALLYETAEQIWTAAVSGAGLTLEQRARVRAAAVWATERAAAVVGVAHRCAGSSSVYDSPLQRRLRDVHTLTQHFLVKRDVLRTAGAVLAGQGLDTPVF